MEFAEFKVDSENNKNEIDFIWLDVRGDNEEDIADINFIESLKKNADQKFFQKSSRRIDLLLRNCIEKINNLRRFILK